MLPRYSMFAALILLVDASPLVPSDQPDPLSTVSNEVADDPSSALSGVYSECLIKISFPCVQRKTLLFIDRLSRLDRIRIVGDYVSIVRVTQQKSPAIVLEESPLDRDEATLRALIDLSIDRFFQTHVVRLQIPPLFPEPEAAAADGTGKAASDDTVVDFTIGDSIQAEGRKKGGGGGGGGGKMKGMKKLMMLMGMMMMTKLIMIAPILMGVMGLAAIKALIFSVMSITISKIMLLKKLKAMMGNKGGHGGGHDSGSSGGWSSGGGGSSGGGWDRSLDDGHPLAYRGYVS
ncbi:uncharacterized protein LOC111051804 [Nilaparvata lugens]|uniref:uncharacterized protein LOC111051804 n=1 Tax=Nilaparvata lugens TaxID=108931 RepID=UPI00193DF523|nr:uncharacterized protein LOC111051804 [Nilaparvata lugens]